MQEDLLIHGDSVYDIIDKQDHQNVQNELGRPPASVAGPHAVVTPADDGRIFLCRMNVSRNARRQMRFGDQKVFQIAKQQQQLKQTTTSFIALTEFHLSIF